MLLGWQKVILKNQVLEVRNVDGRLHVARKVRKADEWDPPIEPYDPYGPGTACPVMPTSCPVTQGRNVSLEVQRARKRRNSKAARMRRKRGQYRRTLTIPGGQLRRLAELGYLERVDDPVAQVRALEAFLFNSLQ